MAEGRAIDPDRWQKSAEGIVDVVEFIGMAEIWWHRRETRWKQRKQTSA